MQEDQAHAWAGLLKVFGHPTRLMILAELLQQTRCVNDMTELLDRLQPNVSQHLMALRDSGLVGFYREGVSRCYYLARPDLVRGLFDLLEREVPIAPADRHTGARRQKAKSSAGPGPG